MNPEREAVIREKLMRAALSWKRRRNRDRIVRAMHLLAAALFGVGVGTRL